jgi:pimeloyl-ACP methyl ester carboxylesterase
MAYSTELSWPVDGITVYGTFTRPDRDGVFPAVVLVAGSGPTDRDWNSPLLPGTNGSGRLLAEVLADDGIASLRYDKRASGPHVRENLPALIGRMSMRSHLDELVSAVDVLSRQDFVDATRVAGLGNSEGCIHVLHYATSRQRVPFAGLVLASPPGRPIGEVLLSQLSRRLGQAPGGRELFPLVEAAAARYSAGAPLDLDPSLPETVRRVLASFETEANLPFARELWVEAVADSLPKTKIPVLVVIGHKDVQVDLHADGEVLQRAAHQMANVSFAFPANANHVLKEDTRKTAEIATAASPGYNEPGTHLDPETVSIILTWLHSVIG